MIAIPKRCASVFILPGIPATASGSCPSMSTLGRRCRIRKGVGDLFSGMPRHSSCRITFFGKMVANGQVGLKTKRKRWHRIRFRTASQCYYILLINANTCISNHSRRKQHNAWCKRVFTRRLRRNCKRYCGSCARRRDTISANSPQF